jgi:hypothetical protein
MDAKSQAELVDQLVRKHGGGGESLKSFGGRTLKRGDTWYAVSSRWVSCWKTFAKGVQYPPKEPGPVDNRDIVVPEPHDDDAQSQVMSAGTKPRVKEGARLGLHYELVPKDAWALLVQWYGCVALSKVPVNELPCKDLPGAEPASQGEALLALPRFVAGTGQKMIEVFPPVIHVESRDLVDVRVCISAFSTVSELKAAACGCLDLDSAKCRIWDMVDSVPLQELDDNLALRDTNVLKDLRKRRVGAPVLHVAHLRNISFSSNQLAAASAAHAARSQLGEITRRATPAAKFGHYNRPVQDGFGRFKGEPCMLPAIHRVAPATSTMPLQFKDARKVLTKAKKAF